MSISHFNYSFLTRLKRKMPIGRRHDRDVFFFAFTLSALVFLLPIAVGLQWSGLHASAWSAYVGLGCIAVALGLWKFLGHLKTALLVYEATLLGLILFNATLLGGITSPVLVWLGIVPLLPLFVASMVWAYGLLALSFLAIAVLYILEMVAPSTHAAGSTSTAAAFAAMMFGTFVLTQMLLITTVTGVAARRLRKIKKDNQRLRTLSAQLSQTNQHKDQFLTRVSHEMRTPLNAIHGYLQLLDRRDDLPKEAAEHIDHAGNSCTHLLGIINDLLDYAQIRQGQFRLNLQATQLPDLIEKAHLILQAQASQKQLAYTCIGHHALPAWVLIDPERLTQILLNLLGNAIKFTQQGHVELHTHYQPETPTRGMLHLSVKDTGPGIPGSLQAGIFQPFFQNRTAPSASNGMSLQGNGLGLSITDSLLRAWQGKIQLESTVGVGSTFRASIPVTCVPPPEAPTAHAAPAESAWSTAPEMRILIVDDHGMNRMIAAATIRKDLPQSRIDEAENGEQALQKMAAHHYDIVLMDILMPDMSGIEVLQTVRKTYPRPYRDVKTLAFTANLDAHIQGQCEQAGFDGFIPKPFNAQSLIQTLIRTSANAPAGLQQVLP